jgi:hypothetical protein
MGNRLSKIATRTGDAGETGLGDGRRVPKDAARVQAMGDVDELNSALGVLLAEKLPAAIRAALLEIQHPGPFHAESGAGATARCPACHPQRKAAAVEGVHPARRLASRGARTSGAHSLPSRRA